MLVDYNGQKPMTFTLQSGSSLYLYPKQRNVEISEQDFFHTGKLARLRRINSNLFTNLRYDEDVNALTEKPEPSNTKHSKKDDFDFTDEKFKPKLDVTGTNKSVMATLASGEEKSMGKGERRRKVHKKHTKLVDYQENVKLENVIK